MERFAIKIDNALKLNLYKLCRLCGIDHPDKRPIINTLSLIGLNDDDEPDLCKKILDCVGIQVKKNDHMPQNICSLCSDKICDFYEYREMCAATNVQTRKLLGLPEIAPNTGRKRKGKDKIKAEETILGIDGADEDDDKKNIIPHIPITPAGVKGGGVGKAGRKKNIGPMSSTAGTSKSSSSFNKGIKRTYENMDSMINDDDDDDTNNTIKIENDYLPSGIKSSYSAASIAKRSNLRNSSSFSNLLEPMVVITPLSELLMPKTESMGGTVLAKPKKSVKFKSDLTVATTPLLTTKALNKRERKREIEMEKLEKKKKRKNGPVDVTCEQPQPKILKVEPVNELCPICCQVLDVQLNDHLIMEHCPRIQKFGCSSCCESFKTNDEQKDHHLWHSLSQTLYKCSVCSLTFDKLQTFMRHVNLCIPLDVSKYLVDDIMCDICKKIFPTRYSHDSHKCYLKTNGICLRCNRRFVKKATLKRHISECTGDYALAHAAAQANLLSQQLAAVAVATMAAISTASGIKSEPEAILDSDVTMPNLKIIEANSVPSITTPTTTNTNINNDDNLADDGDVGDNNADDYDDAGDMGGNNDDHHFGGESSDDENNAESNLTVNTTKSTGEIMNIKTEPNDLANFGEDDGNETDNSDVIIVENDTTPVVIADDFTSPQKKRDKKLKKHKKDKQQQQRTNDDSERDLSTMLLLGTSVKQEPIDNYFADNGDQDNNSAGDYANENDDNDNDNDDEVDNSLMNALNPEIRIKTEPIENDISKAVTTSTTLQKKKEKRHKPTKEKRPSHNINDIRIKEEPHDDTETTILASSKNTTVLNPCSHPVVSFPCTNQSSTATSAATATTATATDTSSSTSSQLPFSINIKKEPITSGYIEPHMIKKEPIDRPANKQPSLRLKITKQHGTLNAKIISNKNVAKQGVATVTATTTDTTVTNEIDSNSEIPSVNPLTDGDKELTTSDSPSTSSETSTIVSTPPPPPPPPPQPPQLTQKSSKKQKNIYKMPALLALKIQQEKMARLAKEKEALENQQQMPLIAHVTSGELPIQIKMEKLSPTHEPDYYNDQQNNDNNASQAIEQTTDNDNDVCEGSQSSKELDPEIPLQESEKKTIELKNNSEKSENNDVVSEEKSIELKNNSEHLENNDVVSETVIPSTPTPPALPTPPTPPAPPSQSETSTITTTVDNNQLNVDQSPESCTELNAIDEKVTEKAIPLNDNDDNSGTEPLSNDCETTNIILPEISLPNHAESPSVTLSNDITTELPSLSTPLLPSLPTVEPQEYVPLSENIESELLQPSLPMSMPELPTIQTVIDDKLDKTDVIQRENEATLSRLVEIGSGAKKLLSDDEINQIDDFVDTSIQNVSLDQPSLQDNHYMQPNDQQLPSPPPPPKLHLEQPSSTTSSLLVTKEPEEIIQSNNSFTDQYYDDQLDDLSDDSLTDVLGPPTDGGIDNSNTTIDWELEQKLLDETPQSSTSATTNHNNQIH